VSRIVRFLDLIELLIDSWFVRRESVSFAVQVSRTFKPLLGTLVHGGTRSFEARGLGGSDVSEADVSSGFCW